MGLWCPLPTTSMARANIPGSAAFPRDSPGVVLLAVFPAWSAPGEGRTCLQGVPQSWAPTTAGQGCLRPCTSLKAGPELGSWSPQWAAGASVQHLLGAGL